jgi:hypothetical protein
LLTRARRPPVHFDGFRSGEPGEVDQHDDRFDPDRRGDGVDEASEVVVRELVTDRFEGVFDPTDA